MTFSKSLVAVVCTIAVAAAAVVVTAPSGEAGKSAGVSPGVVQVNDGGFLFLSAYNPTTKPIDLNIELRATGAFAPHWSALSATVTVAPGDRNNHTFTCDTGAAACPAVPVISSSVLVLSGTYDGAVGYEVPLDAGSFRSL